VLDEVVADRDHDVGVLEARHRVVARLQADGAERLGVGVVHDALAHERLGHRDPGRARELAQRGRRARAHDPVAGERDGVDRVADEVGGAEEVAGARLGLADPPARQRLAVELHRHDVLGQLDVGGPRLLGLGDLERLADDLRDDLRRVDARVPLRDRPHDLDQVDVLVRLLVHALQIRLAGERHERRAVEERVGHGGDEVRRARPQRSQAHARAARQAAVHVGHERPALLVADRHEGDR
jgi:hypothetical protein